MDVAGPRLAGIWLGAVFGLCMLLKETFLAGMWLGAIFWLVHVIEGDISGLCMWLRPFLLSMEKQFLPCVCGWGHFWLVM